MHELPVINSILKVVLKHAVSNNVSKVIAVHLDVGELSDLKDKFMQQYFDQLAKGGIAQGAKLKINRIPLVLKCTDCDRSYSVSIKEDEKVICPECHSEKKTLVSGREYKIRNLEAI